MEGDNVMVICNLRLDRLQCISVAAMALNAATNAYMNNCHKPTLGSPKMHDQNSLKLH